MLRTASGRTQLTLEVAVCDGGATAVLTASPYLTPHDTRAVALFRSSPDMVYVIPLRLRPIALRSSLVYIYI